MEYLFMAADMTADDWSESPWQVGQCRAARGKTHPSWLDALTVMGLPTMACAVQPLSDGRYRLIAAADASAALLAFAIACAERAQSHVRTPDPRSVAAVAVSRRYAVGEATAEELAAARAAAKAAADESKPYDRGGDGRQRAAHAVCGAAYSAACAATWPARVAFWAVFAARDAAGAQASEAAWQQADLAARIDGLLGPLPDAA